MAVLDKLKEVFHHHDTSSTSASTTPTTPSTAPTTASTTDTATPPSPLSKTPAFDSSKVTVIFVLGGPGAGKGTQCEKLVADYGFKHLSAGDLLRAEQSREGSTLGEMIKNHIKEGLIVPTAVTVKLLENAMTETFASPPSGEAWSSGRGRFLIDGFPREMDQAKVFDATVCQSAFVLFINTSEDVMLSRLLKRGETSGRADDNKESIVKRFRTFVNTSMPVVNYYKEQDKVVDIDSSPAPEVVYENVRLAVDSRLPSTTTSSSAPHHTAGTTDSTTTTTHHAGVATEGLNLGAPIV